MRDSGYRGYVDDAAGVDAERLLPQFVRTDASIRMFLHNVLARGHGLHHNCLGYSQLDQCSV